MATCVQTHARIRINFVNSPLDSAWMLVDYKKLPLISDIVYEINKRYFGGNAELSLSLQGSVLPLEERSLLLRDDDAVTARAERQDSSTDSSKIISAVEVKKTKKRKHEETDSEEVSTKEQSSAHGSSRDEDRHSRKKRKKDLKKKERERLKEIADIVSSYTDISHTHSSKHESTCSKDVSSSSKKMQSNESHSSHRKKEDTSKVVAGTSKTVKKGESDRQNKQDESHQDSDRSGHVSNKDHLDSDKDHHHDSAKHKKKRHRKHRKHKSKMSPENKAHTDNFNTSQTNESQTNESQANRSQTGWDQHAQPYTGNPVNPGQTFYGALPDKLLQPKYYRHQYHNLRKFTAEPNTHTKFPSDSETEEKAESQNLEQYNFLSSTRYSEYQDRNGQEAASLDSASPGVQDNSNANYVEVTAAFQSSSTPNTSENSKELSGNRSMRNDNEFVVETHISELRQESDNKQNISNTNINNNSIYNGSFCNGYSGEESPNPASKTTPTALVESRLPNGVAVYSRQRRRNPVVEIFSKEEQLNDVATNRSFIIQNPVKQDNVQNDEFKIDPGETLQAEKYKKDYTQFPALAGPPRIGDRIAYRILEMSSKYTPEVSDYKEAEVIKFDQATQNVCLKNLHKAGSNNCRRGNRFDISVEYEDTVLTNVEEESDEAMFNWTSLLEPRLVS